MTLVDVIMPQLGESLTEGTVSEWLKAPGDEVARDEPLLTVETEKVNTTIEAETGGTLEEILIEQGTVVSCGTVIARIRSSEPVAAVPAASHSPAAPAQTPTPSTPAPARGHLGSDAQATTFPAHASASSGEPGAGLQAAAHFGGRTLELAQHYGVTPQELARLARTLNRARPSPQDILRYVADRSLSAPAPVVAAIAAAPTAATTAPATRTGEPPARYRYRPDDRDLVRHLSAKRMAIADHMSWSRTISAHATALMEVDMSAAAAFLKAHRDAHQAATGVRLTYTAIIAHAAIRALEPFPELNASIVDDSLVIKPYVNLGIAVAIRDNRELVVPVIHDAESLAFADLARSINDLTRRAREGQLTPADVQGGSFTFSNPGTVGGFAGTPIINQPQVAVLAANAIVRRPVVVDDSDKIQVRPIMLLSLSMDHRIIDGALGFAYLAEVRKQLEGFAEKLN